LTIVANADGIFNIVTMLLDNAVKFTPDGGAFGVTATLADGIVRLGIGLAYVHKMASLLRGQVFVESEPGQGSRFTVTLPASE